MNSWLKDRRIKAFFSVTQDESFSVGAKNCMNLVGIGKCKLVVFQATGSGRHGFDIQLAMGIFSS